MDKLHREPARLHNVPCLTGDELGPVQQAVLLQLQLDKAGGHAGSVDGGVDRPQHVGQRPDVVLVSVGDKDAPNLILVLNQVAHVRNDHIDAVHVVVRKAHAHVHHDDVAAVLVDGEVLANLVQTAEGNNFQFFCHIYSFLLLLICIPTEKFHGTSTVPLARHPDEGPHPPRPCLAG